MLKIKEIKKWISLVIIVTTLLGGLITYLKIIPIIKSKLLTYTQAYLLEHHSLDLEVQNISLNLFKSSLVLEKVLLKNQGSKVIPQSIINQIKLQELEFNLNFLSLVSGRIEPKYLGLTGLDLSLDLSKIPAGAKSKGIDLSPIFKITSWIEGMKIELNQVNLELNIDQNYPRLNLKNLSIATHFEKTQIDFQIGVEQFQIPSWNQPLPLALKLKGSIEPDSITLDLAELTTSYLQLDSKIKINNLEKLFVNPVFEAKGSLHIQSHDIINAVLPTQFKLGGDLQTDFDFQINDSLKADGQILITTKKFKLGNYYIGDLSLNGKLKKNSLNFEQFTLKQKEIDIRFTQFELYYQTQPFEISTFAKVDISNFELQTLFQSLSLPKIPVFLKIKGNSTCDGTLYPNFQLDCLAEAQGHQLKIAQITQLNSFEAKGTYQIDLESIKYQSQIIIPQQKAKGSSQGEISYREGFKIKFSGEHIDLAALSPIAGLQVLGFADTQGEVTGNSQTANLNMTIQSPDFVFQNMQFKKTKTQMTYEKGWLKFDNIKSELSASQVDGFVYIDLYNSLLEMKFSSNDIKGEDLQFIFDNYLIENMISQGQGTVFFQAQGPFNWRDWNTQIKINFSKLLILNEYTDQLLINAKIQDDFLEMGPSYLLKGPYRINLTGEGGLKNNASVQLQAIDLPLDQFDNISLLNSEISGLFNMNLKLLNPLGALKILGNFSIDQINLNEVPLPSIKAKIDSQVQNTNIEFQYGSDAFLFDLKLPHQSNELAKIDLSARQFDPRPFFTLIGSHQVVEDYQSSLTLDFNYSFKPAQFFQGSGALTFNQAFVQRYGASIQLEKPTVIEIQDGWVKNFNLKLSGYPEQKIFIQAEGQLEQNFTCQLKTQIELQLIHPFLPFLDDLRGLIQSDIAIKGLPMDPSFRGQISLKKGQVQIKNINQSFTQAEALVQLEDRKINVTQFKADFGQGQVTANGQIEYVKWGQVPINIPIRINNAIIEPIDGARVKTSAVLNLSGYQFPYTITGQINILEGYVSRDFDSGENTQIKRSSLLPKVIFKQALNPIILDTQLNLTAPIVIRNNLIEGQITGALSINGSIYDPKLNGQIRVQEYSKVFFRDNEFRIDNGLIQLNGLASEINPGLVISATSRIDRYDVSLTVNGSVNQPLIRLSSQPVLPEPDLISLLALGQISNEVERRLQTPSSQSQAEAQIGSVLLQNIPLFKKAQKATGVSIQISSAFDADQNAEFRKISFTKRLGNKTRIVAATGDYGFREFKFEYSLSPKLSAIGRFRQQDFIVNSLNIERQNRADSIFGLDLEYRKEFQ